MHHLEGNASPAGAKKFATLEIFWQIFVFFGRKSPNFTLIRESCPPCVARNRKIGHLSNFNTVGCPAGNYAVVSVQLSTVSIALLWSSVQPLIHIISYISYIHTVTYLHISSTQPLMRVYLQLELLPEIITQEFL